MKYFNSLHFDLCIWECDNIHLDSEYGGTYFSPINKKEYESKFIELYELSIKENIYWEWCNFETFKETLQERFTEFQSKFPDSLYKEFITEEKNTLYNCHDEYDMLYLSNVTLDFINKDLFTSLGYTLRRKLEYLNSLEEKEIDFISESISNDTAPSKTKEDWFLVGLLIITGNYQLINQNEHKSVSQISKELFGDRYNSYKPYLTDSISLNPKMGTKNIFKSRNKVIELKDYCQKNNVSVIQDFKEVLKYHQIDNSTLKEVILQ